MQLDIASLYFQPCALALHIKWKTLRAAVYSRQVVLHFLGYTILRTYNIERSPRVALACGTVYIISENHTKTHCVRKSMSNRV